MMDRGTVRNLVEFHFKNKFEKLLHLVGFITVKKYACYSHEHTKFLYGLPTVKMSLNSTTTLHHVFNNLNPFNLEANYSNVLTSFG